MSILNSQPKKLAEVYPQGSYCERYTRRWCRKNGTLFKEWHLKNSLLWLLLEFFF